VLKGEDSLQFNGAPPYYSEPFVDFPCLQPSPGCTAINERVGAELRAEAFNVLNHTEFANPDTTLTSGTFGQITSTTFGTGIAALQTQRILQLAVRVISRLVKVSSLDA
jgi:hypothetical protein